MRPGSPTREELISQGYEVFELETTPLARLLRKNSAPSVIDYLSLDLEGAEEDVLRRFPFDEYVFRALTIESPNANLKQLLRDNGYVFLRESGVDACYVHQTFMAERELRVSTLAVQ